MDFIRHYHFPDSAAEEFTDYVEEMNGDASPYRAPLANPYRDFPDLPYAFAAKLTQVLEEVPPSSKKDHADAQAILNEWAAQRAGCGSLAYTIDNMPIDRRLPATPQLPQEEPVNNKETSVSEAAMLGATLNEGMQPYSQPGMQGGALPTQVIPKPNKDPHEQTNEGRTVLALHTEISSAPDAETPKRQYLLGLRGGEKQAPVGQRLFTTVVPIRQVLKKMSEIDIDLLHQDLFHFISGKAIKDQDDVIERDGPILSTNKRGITEMRFHADSSPDHIRVTVREPKNKGDKEEARKLAQAQAVLEKLRKACDVTKDPALNSSVAEITPRRFLSWNNRELLHGRASTGLLLQNAIAEEKTARPGPSLKIVRELFTDGRPLPKLLEEFERTKPTDGQLTAPDPDARWVQRMRGVDPDEQTRMRMKNLNLPR